jgi:N-acetylglucosaminyl-diphospho-decaprenol L-rhamnosyltransferase
MRGANENRQEWTEARRAVVGLTVLHDSAAVTRSCLASFERAGVPVLAVDNASRDRSADIAEQAQVELLRHDRNQGYGRAMNAGLKRAGAPLVLLANPDITFEPGAVEALVAAAGRYPDAAIFGPRIVEPDGRLFFPRTSLLAPILRNPIRAKWTPEGDCCVPFLSGACWLVRRDVILALGGFDPEIFLFYEDDDLCRRVMEAGHSLVHVQDAVVRHVRGGSTAPAPGRIFRSRFHLAWSRAYVLKKWGIPDDPRPHVVRSGIKWLAAAATLNRRRMERHAGIIAGVLAFRRGERAVLREGLGDRAP